MNAITPEDGSTDYYAILGVSPLASLEEVRAAFRARIKKVHPDRNLDPNATDEARVLVRGWEILRDRMLRADYDAIRGLAAGAGDRQAERNGSPGGQGGNGGAHRNPRDAAARAARAAEARRAAQAAEARRAAQEAEARRAAREAEARRAAQEAEARRAVQEAEARQAALTEEILRAQERSARERRITGEGWRERAARHFLSDRPNESSLGAALRHGGGWVLFPIATGFLWEHLPALGGWAPLLFLGALVWLVCLLDEGKIVLTRHLPNLLWFLTWSCEQLALGSRGRNKQVRAEALVAGDERFTNRLRRFRDCRRRRSLVGRMSVNLRLATVASMWTLAYVSFLLSAVGFGAARSLSQVIAAVAAVVPWGLPALGMAPFVWALVASACSARPASPT